VIVTCQACETSFQLDESRIPEKGIRVRCSRCREAFFLPHPSLAGTGGDVPSEAASTGSRDAHEARARALEESFHRSDEDAPPPSETPAALDDDDLSFDDLDRDELDRDGLDRDELDEDESDWEFNEALPGEGGAEVGGEGGGGAPPAARAGDAEAPAEIDFSDLDDADSAGAPLRLAEEPEPPPPAAAPGPTGGAAADEPVIGTADDFSDLAEEDPDTVPDPALQPPAVAGAAASAVAADDPEDWDFFADDEGPPASGSSAGAPLSPPAIPDGPGPDIDDSLPPPARDLGPAVRAARVAGHAIGWCLLVALVTFILERGLWPLAPVGSAMEVAGLQALGARGEWVDTAQNGRLYVVSGILQSGARGRVPPPLEVAMVSFRDGSVVARSLVGREIPDAELRELPHTELPDVQREAALALMGEPMRSPAGQPFAAVFEHLPGDALRFVVRPASAETLEAAGIAPPAGGVLAGAVPAAAPLASPAPVADPTLRDASPAVTPGDQAGLPLAAEPAGEGAPGAAGPEAAESAPTPGAMVPLAGAAPAAAGSPEAAPPGDPTGVPGAPREEPGAKLPQAPPVPAAPAPTAAPPAPVGP